MDNREAIRRMREAFYAVDAEHDKEGLSPEERSEYWTRMTDEHCYSFLLSMTEAAGWFEKQLQWIDHTRFVTRGRSGETEPHDTNYAALLVAVLRLVPPLGMNGHCSKDVYENASSLNHYTTTLKPPFRPNLETVKACMYFINEKLLPPGFKMVYEGDEA